MLLNRQHSQRVCCNVNYAIFVFLFKCCAKDHSMLQACSPAQHADRRSFSYGPRELSQMLAENVAKARLRI